MKAATTNADWARDRVERVRREEQSLPHPANHRPYPGQKRGAQGDRTRVKMAMAINGVAFAREVTHKDWLEVEQTLGLDATSLVDFGVKLCAQINEKLPNVLAVVRAQGLEQAVLDQLEWHMPQHVDGCLHALKGASSAYGSRPRRR